MPPPGTVEVGIKPDPRLAVSALKVPRTPQSEGSKSRVWK